MSEIDKSQICKGDYICIIDMEGEPQYSGKSGYVTYIDDAHQIHGTWGGCAIIPNKDRYKLCKRSDANE